ncbi:hypothetical protein Y032_0085g1865 [Ancylostoma ceylanicum]|uniref:Uncharacterized protein n=1 Tax=Ancylostoma ceylanicum TaxID=53326 RepID=A0A016TR78_9BILA|nr:hypothetical protein Y032_0085g1865 [Ancylostoma ceylanicum]
MLLPTRSLMYDNALARFYCGMFPLLFNQSQCVEEGSDLPPAVGSPVPMDTTSLDDTFPVTFPGHAMAATDTSPRPTNDDHAATSHTHFVSFETTRGITSIGEGPSPSKYDTERDMPLSTEPSRGTTQTPSSPTHSRTAVPLHQGPPRPLTRSRPPKPRVTHLESPFGLSGKTGRCR